MTASHARSQLRHRPTLNHVNSLQLDDINLAVKFPASGNAWEPKADTAAIRASRFRASYSLTFRIASAMSLVSTMSYLENILASLCPEINIATDYGTPERIMFLTSVLRRS